MKNICLLSVFILITIYSATFGQSDTIKKGAYRNHIDFAKNQPLYESRFYFSKQNNRKIPELYFVRTTDLHISYRKLKKVIWGIYDGGAFYINAGRIGMKEGYIRIEKLERYSYFKGIPIKSLIQKDKLNQSAYMFGATGAVLTSIEIAKENKNKIHYVLNLETGMVNLLTRNYMLMVLQPHPELLNAFQAEENNESIDVLLKYIDLLNKK
jgi:hypothetical protein